MEVWSLSSRIKVLYLKIWRKCVVTVTDSAFEGSFYLGEGDLNKSVFSLHYINSPHNFNSMQQNKQSV